MRPLTPEQRTKLDNTEDALFYEMPRFVTHVDDRFIQKLTRVYRDHLRPQTRILDLMSSWISHLPPEMTFAHVEGHGMNAAELAANRRLDHYFVQDLNQNPVLPLASASFDAVLIAVSVQYLQQPEQVFREIRRVLQPGGVTIVSFSNRMFYQKAIQAWRDGTDRDRLALVKSYFASVPDFCEPEIVADPGSACNGPLQWLGMATADPFYAVIAQAI
ncbi:class I SAM-dependent methyltransferase [Trichothermofontia sp.]